ncbi:hypothetical protein V499_08825 [Pseudogymnoascus sp. VKM F-103]|nr:hypothetical protein V499_08825 [Pseudogymnoascus sp. VKM F-103]
MLSSKSVANVANLIQSPYREYVEEICWADRELQYHLHDDLEAFQDTFKERFAGLSRDDVAQWHEKYRTMYRDQESVYSPLYDGSAQLHLESFINLKRVSVDNGCELRTEQYPVALDAPEILNNLDQWSTMVQPRPQHGGLYALILKPLSESPHTLTHFSIKTQGSKRDEDVSPPRGSGIYVPLFMFKNVQHLYIDFCLSEIPLSGQVSTVVRHLGNPRKNRNLQSLTMKTHPHAVDEKGHLARPLEELLYVWKRPTFMRLMPMLYPQLRHLEFHGFAILSRALLECLGMVRKSLRSLVFSNCVFKPTLLVVFTNIREKKLVRLVTIFKHSKDFFYRSIPEKPSTLTDKAITPYLVQSRMNGTLCLHDWDKQVKEYADENSRDARDVEGAEDA